MAFYAVWVQTGKEQTVTDELVSRQIPGLQSIFTLDRFIAILPFELPSINSVVEMQGSDYLQKQELRELLATMRTVSREHASTGMDTREMMQSYRKSLQELTAAFTSKRSNEKSLLQGYLLLEMDTQSEQLDAKMWHLIKDVPYVIGFPSDFAIPEAEIAAFFTRNPFVYVLKSVVNQIMWPFTLDSVIFRITSQVEGVHFVWSSALRQFVRKRLV